jgi:predicted nuclease of predicted toxin-antitoxin system
MYLLLDECCGKALVRVAAQAGHSAQRTVEVAVLGRQAPDRNIIDFARRAGAVFVTVNRGDFIHLAARGRDHPGVILIPSLPHAELRPLFEAVLVAAEPLFARTSNLFVEVDAKGVITSFQLPRSNQLPGIVGIMT